MANSAFGKVNSVGYIKGEAKNKDYITAEVKSFAMFGIDAVTTTNFEFFETINGDCYLRFYILYTKII